MFFVFACVSLSVYVSFSGKRVKIDILVALPDCQIYILISTFILIFT